jgi:hypothetical protein
LGWEALASRAEKISGYPSAGLAALSNCQNQALAQRHLPVFTLKKLLAGPGVCSSLAA